MPVGAFEAIIELVRLHHQNHGRHGVNCACMDEWIRQIRHMTTVTDKKEQARIDHVLRSALESRR